MKVTRSQVCNEWLFRVEHMGNVISGWSLDEQGAEHAIKKSSEFLVELSRCGLTVEVERRDHCAGAGL